MVKSNIGQTPHIRWGWGQRYVAPTDATLQAGIKR